MVLQGTSSDCRAALFGNHGGPLAPAGAADRNALSPTTTGQLQHPPGAAFDISYSKAQFHRNIRFTDLRKAGAELREAVPENKKWNAGPPRYSVPTCAAAAASWGKMKARSSTSQRWRIGRAGRHPRLGHHPQSGVRDKIALVRRTSASRRSTISRLR